MDIILGFPVKTAEKHVVQKLIDYNTLHFKYFELSILDDTDGCIVHCCKKYQQTSYSINMRYLTCEEANFLSDYLQLKIYNKFAKKLEEAYSSPKCCIITCSLLHDIFLFLNLASLKLTTKFLFSWVVGIDKKL